MTFVQTGLQNTGQRLETILCRVPRAQQEIFQLNVFRGIGQAKLIEDL